MFSERQKKCIEKYRESGDYTAISTDFGSGGIGVIDDAFTQTRGALDALQLLFDEIPDTQKYQVVMDVYMMSKSPAKEMLNYIKAIKSLVPDNLTATIKDHIDDSGNLTIYRGGLQVKNPGLCTSWTLSKEQAEWFAKRYIDRPDATDTVVYRGFVKATDIIGYTNDREEQEIIQYQSVENIEIVDKYEKPSDEKIATAVSASPLAGVQPIHPTALSI